MLNVRLMINGKIVLFFIGSLILLINWCAKSQNFPMEFSERSADNYKLLTTLEDSNITLVGEWPWGQCRAVAVRDNDAFIGNGK